jgi:MFS family permease
VLLYGVIEGQRYSWGEIARGVTIPEVIAAGVVLLAAFCWRERRQAQPLLPGALLRNRTFAIMVLLNLATQFALQSMLLVNSINLQSVLGFTAVHAGLTGLPLTLALTAVAPFAGRLTDRFGGKFVLAAGLTIYAAGIAGVAVLSSDHATSWTFAPALLVAGIGMGAIFAPVATTGMRAAPPELAGAASGALNTGRQLGGTIGGAVTGAVLATRLTSALQARAVAAAASLPQSARHPFVAGFARAASAGLQVGRGQSAATLPRGVPAALASRLQQLAHDVFVHSYLQAMRPTLAISVALLLAGAASCLLLRRHPAADPGSQQVSAKPIETAGADAERNRGLGTGSRG